MDCPCCKKPMIKGKVVSTSSYYFLPDGEKHPIFYTKGQMEKNNAVPLSTLLNDYLHGERRDPVAYACEECKMIMISY